MRGNIQEIILNEETCMCTIFHKGHDVLVQEIGNHHYAKIADWIYLRIHGSKYHNEQGDQTTQKPLVQPSPEPIQGGIFLIQILLKN